MSFYYPSLFSDTKIEILQPVPPKSPMLHGVLIGQVAKTLDKKVEFSVVDFVHEISCYDSILFCTLNHISILQARGG